MADGESPPSELRAIIDKTIPLVREGGAATAGRLLSSNPRLFGFLDAADRWNSWYEWRATNAGADPDVSAEGASAEGGPAPGVERLIYAYDQPEAISMRQLETLKLVARKMAVDPQFSPSSDRFRFLSTDSAYHGLFESFLEQYKSVVAQRESDKIRLAESKRHDAILRRALSRAQWISEHPPETTQEDSARAVSFAEIDWPNFRVIASIDVLKADKKAALPAPLTPDTIVLRTPRFRSTEQPAPAVKEEPALKSPYTGEMVPASLYEEHMRVHGLDPRWGERKRMQQEEAEKSNLVVEEAYSNLQRQTKRKRKD